jgi:hypothetical protein
VEDELDGVHRADRAGRHALAQRERRGRAAVGHVDAEQPPGALGRRDHRPRLGGAAAERLLAEHGHAALQRGDRLLGVQRAGRRDDDPVEVGGEQLLEVRRVQPGARRGARGGGEAVAVGIGERRDVRLAARRDRLQAQPADPAGPEEAHPWKRRCRDRRHGRTSALRKPSGRASAVANASPICASPNSCV